MNEGRLTRREFLEASTLAATGLALAAHPGEAAAAAQAGPRVRRNFGTLDPIRPEDKRIIDGYTEGVRILRQRSDVNWNDLRGWAVQAGLHTGRCQHGNWWFLPWHRAYLYFFERMIQDAIGDPAFALPYWDWTDNAQLALPGAFRVPNSPLYDGFRRPSVNAGTSRLNWSNYPGGVLNYVLGIPSYVPSLSSPAANTFPGLERTHGPDLGHASLEGGPHDYVHVWVAGSQQRDMGDPTYAALDPIFWLHHCNIDRLWTRWLLAVPGRRHPANAVWRNQSFQFLNPSGTLESITVDQVLNTRSAPLNYRYDDEPAVAPAALMAAAIAVPAGTPQEMIPMAAPMHPQEPLGQTLAVANLRYQMVGGEPLTLELPITPAAHTSLNRLREARAAAGAAAQPGLHLAIENVAFEAGASDVVAVYLNAPLVGGVIDPTKGQFLGTIALFAGHAHEATPPGDGPPSPPPREDPNRQAAMAAQAAAPAQITRIFDVSGPVLDAPAVAPAAGAAPPAPLRVTLVRQPLDADPQGALPLGKVTFSRAALLAPPQ
jgi:polyphenol oxidase